MLLEVIGSYHHGGGAKGVAGAFEVVPFDAIELPDVVSNSVVDTVQVGETTGVKPPTWWKEGRRKGKRKRAGGKRWIKKEKV